MNFFEDNLADSSMSYDDFSHGQKAALAILPKISSVFSLFGSGWIVVEVLTHNTGNLKFHHPYHRLLLAMSVYDILESVWNFASTWPIPAESNKLWATGTTQTCTAQGFFLTLSVAVPIYNALLAVYYMLVIKYQTSDQMLVKRVEPFMHVLAGVWAFFTAVFAASTGLINDAGLWCWIAPYPSDCLDTIRHGEQEGNCERGDNAWVYQWAFYFAPLWLCILMATACTVAVYFFVRNLDEKTLRYRKPQSRKSLMPSRFGSQMSARTLMNRRKSKLDGNSIDGFRLSGSDEQQYDDDDDDDENDDDVMDLEEYVMPLAGGASAGVSDGAVLEGRVRLSLASAPSAVFGATSAEMRRCSEISQLTMELEADMDNDDFLAGRGRVVSITEPATAMLSQIQQSARSHSESIRQGIENWQQRRQIYRDDYPRTIAVIEQACWYLGTFYLTHVWSTTNRLLQLLGFGRSVRGRFALSLIHSWFDPFQGFLNYCVYQRPRYLFIRKSMPELGRIRAALRALRFTFQKQNELNQAADEGIVIRRTPDQAGQPPTSSSSLPPATSQSRRRSSASLLGLSRQSVQSSVEMDIPRISTTSRSMITSIVEEEMPEVEHRRGSDDSFVQSSTNDLTSSQGELSMSYRDEPESNNGLENKTKSKDAAGSDQTTTTKGIIKRGDSSEESSTEHRSGRSMTVRFDGQLERMDSATTTQTINA